MSPCPLSSEAAFSSLDEVPRLRWRGRTSVGFRFSRYLRQGQRLPGESPNHEKGKTLLRLWHHKYGEFLSMGTRRPRLGHVPCTRQDMDLCPRRVRSHWKYRVSRSCVFRKGLRQLVGKQLLSSLCRLQFNESLAEYSCLETCFSLDA